MSTSQNPPRPLARPAFPPLQATSSTNSSAYQSYQSSASSLSTPSSASAPLPSPSSTHPHQQGFFSSLHQQQPTGQQQQQQQNQHVHPSQYDYQPNRDGAGRTAAETNNFLGQAALLAEAAKRAQMAVVMRDIEGMEL